ncbi:MAG: hypothetical protein PHT50_07650 [Candidatus Omnitrophica bacterium]|nr:hypothetical protein [Candidatus Omnitrophota bacterium]
MLAKKFALGFGIAIIFPVMVHYGVSTFVPSPKWQERYSGDYYQNYNKATPEEKAKLEEEKKQREADWTAKEKRFQLFLFLVAVPLGIAAILIGSLAAIQAVGTGLMFGGIFLLLDGYCNYWSELADSMRFLSLLLAFIVLLYIGYKKIAK